MVIRFSNSFRLGVLRLYVSMSACPSGTRRAVGGRDRLVTARADGGEHAVDERGVVPGMDAERVARQIGRRLTVDGDLVVARVLFGSRSGESEVDEVSAREILLLLSRHAPAEDSRKRGQGPRSGRCSRDATTRAFTWALGL